MQLVQVNTSTVKYFVIEHPQYGRLHYSYTIHANGDITWGNLLIEDEEIKQSLPTKDWVNLEYQVRDFCQDNE